MAIPPQSHAFGSSLGGTQVAQQNIFNGLYFSADPVTFLTLCFLESKTRFRTITDWFSPITFAQKQRDVYRPEYSGSKEGFFESSEFKSWKRGDIQALWCCGIGRTPVTDLCDDDRLMRVVPRSSWLWQDSTHVSKARFRLSVTRRYVAGLIKSGQ